MAIPIESDTEPCKCGSGKTYKNCHQSSPSLPMLVKNYPGEDFAVGKDRSTLKFINSSDIQWTYSEMAFQKVVFRVIGDTKDLKVRLDGCPSLHSQHSTDATTSYMLLGLFPSCWKTRDLLSSGTFN
eukprot:comp16737_c1_seq2/m.15044 comp16737_c1_seq2/g.15044  ORF comp16737_c1_seq2/g.15044 comp16737_c1_seq2/m.15044 type:complete len:127 (-) comp16737_c1_seq2:121-501(-)